MSASKVLRSTVMSTSRGLGFPGQWGRIRCSCRRFSGHRLFDTSVDVSDEEDPAVVQERLERIRKQRDSGGGSPPISDSIDVFAALLGTCVLWPSKLSCRIEVGAVSSKLAQIRVSGL